MIEQLVSRVFADRNAAHLAHWKTNSYAQHMALNEFYDAVIGALDALVESYQGVFGLIDAIPEYKALEAEDIADHMRNQAEWIEVNRDEIANGSNSLINMVDAVTVIYMKAAYKLENLQ